MYKKIISLVIISIVLSACTMKEEADDALIHSSYYYVNHFPKAVEVVNTCGKKENRETQFCKNNKDNIGTAFLVMMKYHKYHPDADLNKLTPENAPEKSY